MTKKLRSVPISASSSSLSLSRLHFFQIRRGNALLLGGVASVLMLTASVRADNIAPLGTGIIGFTGRVNSDAGTAWVNAGTPANINDGDIGTRVDDWSGVPAADNGQGVSFVGVKWPSLRYENIQTLTLYMATFLDGGWFGTNGVGPGGGGALTPDYLVEPIVQVSTNSGTNWTSIAATSDYMTVMNGWLIGDPAGANPTQPTVTFTLNTPASAINGIRIIGPNGGEADGNGFIGVYELEIDATPGVDTDADGMADAWETANGLVVGTDDSATDPDNDGLTNLQEFQVSTNPKVADTDGDGLKDGAEVNTTFTNPLLADSDGDGLSDGVEVNTSHTDPTLADTDGDGLTDAAEVNTHHTNPLVTDTDNDGYPDAVEIAQGSDANDPASIPNNLSLQGTAFLGIKDSLDSGPETEQDYAHVGGPENINDGNQNTRVDTYNDAGATTVSYVGIRWDSPITNAAASLKLTLATFLDGGWFGPNGKGPGAGGTLSAAYLTEPLVQITTDGSTWTTVDHTSDYIASLTGHHIGGGTVPNPSSVTATFTLTQPTNNILGIRIIGTEGGQASGGFIGVSELSVLSSSTDVDNDGLDDAWERQHGLIVGTNDSAADPDADGLSNLQEFKLGTDPKLADSDGDGLTDGNEVNTAKTNPLRADTDNDGINDGAEVNTNHTNPLVADSDGDGITDGQELAQGTNPSDPNSFPPDIAPRGTAILGTKTSLDDGGVETPWANAGPASAINDFDVTTRVDTFNGASPDTVSYVGVVWDQPVTTPIVRLDLTLATFFDGGWFGVNNAGPGSGGTLSAADHLIEPEVQVSTNKGTNWQTISFTSDYIQALTGHPLPAVDFGPPTSVTATFQFPAPLTNINGIRIIGTEGGTAGGSGFLGVNELAVLTSTNSGTGGTNVSILNLARVNQTFQFEFDSQAGASHIIEFKNSLNDAAWQTLSTVPGDGSRKTVTDPIAGSARFYRVRTP